MAKAHTYTVSFNRARRTDRGFYQIIFDMAERPVVHSVTADSFLQLEAEVRRLATDYGLPCAPCVRLADKSARKPAGFDAWNRLLHVVD